MMELINKISNWIEQKKDKFIALSHNIWEIPELHFEEHQSSLYFIGALAEEGFEVERGVAGLRTAFVGSFGTGKPIVGILGEYDALAGLSQKKDLPILIRSLMGEMGMGAAITFSEQVRLRQRSPLKNIWNKMM